MRGTLLAWQFWSLTVGAAVATGLFAWSWVIGRGNADLQQEIQVRQVSINQGMQLGQLNNQLINSLARLAADREDKQLTKLLADNGITFNVAPSQAQAPVVEQELPAAGK